MPGRQVRGKEGRFFHLQRYVWRSAPARTSFPSRAIRCVVGQDEHGWFRAGTRLGRAGNNGDIETMFAACEFGTKEEAIEFSRGMTRDLLSAEAECYADRVRRPMPPGETVAKVEMDDGWSVKISAPGELSPPEAKVKEMFERSIGDGKAQSVSRTWSQEIDR